MESEVVHKQLIDIQKDIDRKNLEASKKDFLAKLDLYSSMADTLGKRDELAKEIPDFWQCVFVDSEILDVLYNDEIISEEKEEEIEEAEGMFLGCEWVESISAGYREGFKHYVTLKAKENPFFENAVLEKEFSFFSTEGFKFTEIKWKGKKMLENPLLRFFSTGENDDNVGIFDMLCDLYVNAVYYYVKNDDRLELFDKVDA